MLAISPSDLFPFSGLFSYPENFRLTWNPGGAGLTPATVQQAYIFFSHILLGGCGIFLHKFLVH